MQAVCLSVERYAIGRLDLPNQIGQLLLRREDIV
jgi:hypothetical protein